MTDKNLLTLTINQHQKAYTVEQAFILCKQILVNNSPNFDGILREIVDKNSLEHNQAKHFFQLAFNVYLQRKQYSNLLEMSEVAIKKFDVKDEKSQWADAFYANAVANRYLRKPECAKDSLENAVEINPKQPSWLRLLATMEKELGHFDKALKHLDACVALSPNDAESYWLRSDLSRVLSAPALSNLEGLANREGTQTANQSANLPTSDNLKNRAYACFTLFRYHQNNQDHQTAFSYLTLGNKLFADCYISPAEQQAISSVRQEHQAISDIFSAAFLKVDYHEQSHALEAVNLLGEKSLFICGMPRSGTTLIEQILASHSDINAGDELFYLAEASQEVLISNTAEKSQKPFPFWAPALAQSQWQDIRHRYIQKCQPLAQGNYLTDKMPLNYKAIGIIAKALPKAKVIYCQRNKQDTIWGCYQQILGQGNTFSFDLDDLAVQFDAHRSLMNHWLTVLEEMVFVLDYQQLIEQPEVTVKQLCEFIGIEFQNEMLDFYQNNQPVHTVSSAQVREPLTSRYHQQWQAYRAFLPDTFFND